MNTSTNTAGRPDRPLSAAMREMLALMRDDLDGPVRPCPARSAAGKALNTMDLRKLAELCCRQGEPRTEAWAGNVLAKRMGIDAGKAWPIVKANWTDALGPDELLAALEGVK